MACSSYTTINCIKCFKLLNNIKSHSDIQNCFEYKVERTFLIHSPLGFKALNVYCFKIIISHHSSVPQRASSRHKNAVQMPPGCMCFNMNFRRGFDPFLCIFDAFQCIFLLIFSSSKTLFTNVISSVTM